MIYCMIMDGVKKGKSFFAHGQIWLNLLSPGTLKSALSQLKNKAMN